MSGLLNQIMIAGNSLRSWLIAAIVFSAAIVIIKVFRHLVLNRLKQKAGETATSFDDFILKIADKIASPFLYFLSGYGALKLLRLSEFSDRSLNMLGLAVIVFSATRLALEIFGYGFFLYWKKQGKDLSEDRSLEGILKVIKFVVWSFALIFFLDNLGFKISTVIAGLGIGGIAVALAAQTVLKDLFSYFSILFDRPFELNDFIIVGDYMGTIEKIGIKTTRIRSLGGEQLIFSNADLTDSRVRNYKRMEQRRVVFKFGVTYQTSTEKLKAIPEAVKTIISAVPETRFDRAHFFSYGDFSLVFEVVYYVLTGDYNRYMDLQQEINFSLKEELERRNIEFAYPTQTLYLNKI